MTHQDRNSWRKSIQGGLRSSSPVDAQRTCANFPLRDANKPQNDSERTRHHLHRFFEELLRRSEQ